ncbi:MAG TPA: Mut7-C RNAse domain-containing protein [Nitrososphaera sp.]|nr:Mut7-C RNAse domain-containing protein [Nitrososphaera sp.]
MAPKAPSFIADAMLGSVARKLRIFGFDTLYIAHAHDDEILKVGIEQGRVILTADKELFKRIVKTGAPGVLVSGAGDLDDIVHILSKNRVTSVDLNGIGSRCSMCNGLLEERTPEQVRNGLPDRVAECHREFYQCNTCSKVYWEGGHLRHIRAFARSVDSKLGGVSAT